MNHDQPKVTDHDVQDEYDSESHPSIDLDNDGKIKSNILSLTGYLNS